MRFFKRAASKRDSFPFAQELYALALAAIAVFLGAAFLSFNPHDHSWFYCDTSHAAPTNWCGSIGAHAAALLFYLFGSASFMAVLSLLLFAYFLGIKKSLIWQTDRIIACCLLTMTFAGLLYFHHIDFWKSSCPGGICGSTVINYLHVWLDRFGTGILLYTSVLACAMIISRCSLLSGIAWLCSKLAQLRLLRTVFRPVAHAVSGVSRIVWRPVTYSLNAIKKNLGIQKNHISFNASTRDDEQLYDQKLWHDLMSKKPIASPPKIAEKNLSHSGGAAHEMQEVSQEVPNLTEIPEHSYQLPHLDMFIGVDEELNDQALMQELEKRAVVLQEKLERFDVFGKVTAIKRGPVVTLFEYQPHIDTKISKIVALEDDLALALQAVSIRIIAPIPGKSLVGFEVANKMRRNVLLSQLIKSDVYQSTTASLPMIVGVDTIGTPTIIDLARMPHLLMAGSTGSGKSVSLNAMLISLLCKISPDDLRLVVIDPKRLEFAPYADIAHLLFPIVTDPKQAPAVLRWVVKQMEERYELMAQAGARNIHDYRASAQSNNHDSLPFIVVIIDELADLMMCAGKEVEDAIIRITQMARAAGIHMIAATQRPSVDVITGLIKVNFPSRISFRVTSKIDSRTILDCAGADKLLGRGDMLFLDASDSSLKRLHGAYVLDKEINLVIAHIRSQRAPDYLDLKQVCRDEHASANYEQDQMYEEVCNFIQEIDEVSISLLQRRFRIGYNRSARIIDMLESKGLIAPSYGGKTRKVVRQ